MKKLLRHIGAFFAMLFNGADKFVRENLDEAIMVAGWINQTLKNPIVEAALQFIPGNVAADVAKKIEALTVHVLAELLGDKECLGLPDPKAQLACLLSRLQGLSPELRHATVAKFASYYLQVKTAEREEISERVADALVQARYFQKKELGTDDDHEEGAES